MARSRKKMTEDDLARAISSQIDDAKAFDGSDRSKDREWALKFFEGEIDIARGDRIPLMSRLLLQWGQFAHAHGLQLLAGGAALLVGLVYTLNRPQVRLALARQIQRVAVQIC